MSYFEQLPSLPDYPEAEGNFRFSYNGNSGGGQSFLAGKFKDINGALIAPTTLDNKVGVIKFFFRAADQAEIQVILEDPVVKYLIKPRGAGSSSMKLEVEGKRNPSKALTSFFMLPEGCGVRKSEELAYSALAKKNYWLQTMRLNCKVDHLDPNNVYLIPNDLVFAGGVASDSDASTEKFFKLDFERRVRDIISVSKKEGLPDSIRQQLQLFADIYVGSRPYSFDEAIRATSMLMLETARNFPIRYSGIDDPLPTLVELTSGQTGGALRFQTKLGVKEKRNLIVFGAPGTGKSNLLDKKKFTLLKNGGEFERVTFHPDYTYAHFVGTYKPVPKNDSDGKETITYEYVPGPLMRVLAAALSNGKTSEVTPHLLLIEEINRASAASVFGDIFQLLDRNQHNVSEYPIHASVDVQTYLAKVVGGSPGDYKELRLPDNFFIWSSMNSADQGVFPMDTAFKRRWNFSYLGIDDNEANLVGKLITLGEDEFAHTIEWNALRKSLNNFLSDKGINEDKQIGPYFLSREVSVPDEGDQITPEPFIDAFQQKVLMYLFEDAARHHRASLFAGCDHKGNRYSNVRREFVRKGMHIFNQQIVDSVPTTSANAPEGPNSALSPGTY